MCKNIQRFRLFHKGDYYRLSSPFEDSFTAWEFVAKDQSRMLLNVVITERYGNEGVTYVKCRGLKEEGIYAEKESGQKYTGSMLMEAGIPMPVRMIEYPAYQMEFCIQ